MGTNQYPYEEQQLPHWLPRQVVLPLLGPHPPFVDTFDAAGPDEVLVVDEVLTVDDVLADVVDEAVLLPSTGQVPKPV
jgi:hypothetical protein